MKERMAGDLIPQEVRRACKGQKLMRTVWLLSISTLIYVAQVVGAHASLFCKRIEQLPQVSDGATLRLLEAHIKTFDSPKPLLFREIVRALIPQDGRRFFVIAPDDENCKSSGCYYRLLELKDGVIKETFSFHGTGVVWYHSPVTERIEYFQDNYEMLDLETSGRTYIRLGLPRKENSVFVAALPEQAKLPKTCEAESR